MAFIKTKLSTIRPNDLYDTLRLTYGFNDEEQQKQPGILAKPAEPVSDSDVVAAGFFDYMLTKSRERAAKLRAEAMEQYARDSAEEAAKIRSILGITRSKAPTGQLSDMARDAMFSSSDMRGTDLTMKDNAREAQDVFQPMITPVSRGEQPEMADSPAPVDAPSIDTRSNEMLDKAIKDVLETVLDSDASDSTDSADGGAAPSGGKGIMSPDALTDDDMGLPDERGNAEQVLNAQKKLTNLGFDPKGIDGKVGPGTKRALRKFQKANDLPITGELTSDVIRILDSDKAEDYFDPPKLDAKVDNIPDSEFDVFKEAIAQKESSGRYSTYDVDIPKLGIKKGDPLYGGSGKHYLGRYQMGKDALKDVGRGYNKTLNQAFLDNPDLQDKLFKKFTLRNHKALTKNSGIYRDMSVREKLGVLGYAHNQGVGAAEEWLYTGVSGKDGFGTLGDEYTTLIAEAFANQSSDLAPQTSLRPKARPTD